MVTLQKFKKPGYLKSASDKYLDIYGFLLKEPTLPM